MEKYYLCTKDYDNNNMFLSYAFYSNQKSHFLTKNTIYERKKDSYGNFFIIDDCGIYRPIDEVIEYITPFDFKIEEEAKKIIETKAKKHNDVVKIVPVGHYANKNVTFYSITCRLGSNGRSSFVMATSQLEGIISCYHTLRYQTNTVKKFVQILKIKRKCEKREIF